MAKPKVCQESGPEHDIDSGELHGSPDVKHWRYLLDRSFFNGLVAGFA